MDATLFGDQQCFRIGMCLRNPHDHFLKALTKYDHIPSPFEADALGLKKGRVMA